MGEQDGGTEKGTARERELIQALKVIRKGLTEDADGEFWSARKWLDDRGIYHGDVNGLRVLNLVARHALKPILRRLPAIERDIKEHLERDDE